MPDRSRIRPRDAFIHAIEENAALRSLVNRASSAFDRVVEKLPASRRVTDFLHGTWLGHPLHPALTDVPTGAWSLAAFFDLATLGRARCSPMATRAIAVGIAGAVPAAAAGIVDWRQVDGKERRVGVAHALLNSAALTCYTLSLLTRIAGKGPARGLNLLGFGCAGISAYLGGDLVLSSKIGVRHEAEESAPKQFSQALSLDDLTEGVPRRVELEGFPLVIVRFGSEVHAIADTCPHLGCSLADGEVEGSAITCPCHGSAFSLADGRVLHGPSAFDVQAFDAMLENGVIMVRTALP